jgi:hypothetical protein
VCGRASIYRAASAEYWKDVRYGDLLRAADAGVLEGDPLRPYLILHAEIGNGLLADWGTVLNLWDLAWHVFDRIDTLMGVGAAALGARELIRRLKDRLSRGRSVVSKHYVDWRERQGDPATLAAFLSRTPRTTAQVAGLLGCAEPEAEAVLWAFGLSRDEAPGLDDPPAPSLDRVPGEIGELPCEACSGLVAPLARERRVAADVRDQERADEDAAGRGVLTSFGHRAPSLGETPRPHGLRGSMKRGG